MRSFGEELSQQMFEAGLSYRELSRRTGLAVGTISQLVNGQRSPSDETLSAIAGGLGTAPATFLEWRRRQAVRELDRNPQLVDAIYARIG